MYKKTIFIPITSRRQARNTLRTDALKTLSNAPDVRLIIFVPHIKLDEYIKEFKKENIIFEGINDSPVFFSALDKIFGRISLFYINTPDTRFIRKRDLFLERGKFFRYIFSALFLWIIGSLPFLQKLLQYFDYKFVKSSHFSSFFDRYNPDLLFMPNAALRTARAFLRQTKKRNIKSIGMIESWDNVTLVKHSYRILPNKMIVHNNIIKEQVMGLLHMKEKDIFVSGVPHFDHYINSKRISKEKFYKKLDINPSKRIVLFAAVGDLNPTEWQVLYMLDQAIVKKELPDDIVILARPHPASDMTQGNVKYSENVVFDNSKTTFGKGNNSFSEILKDDMEHLGDSIFHSDVIIGTRSTMCIEGAIFDKPFIDIVFDGWEKIPFHKSVASLYAPFFTYYQHIIKTDGVRLARSLDEIISLLNMYLKDPSIDVEGRKKIIKEQCFKLDRKSGERIGKFVLSQIK